MGEIEPIPEAERRCVIEGNHPPDEYSADVAASRWAATSVGLAKGEECRRVVRHAHLYDADSHYNPTHHVEQMEGEGDLSLLLHHKLATNARSEAALVEYYGEDDGKCGFGIGETRRLPWEERMRKDAKWKAGVRRDTLPASPAAGKGPGASPARRSSRSHVSDANGVTLLGEYAEVLPNGSTAWSIRTPSRSGADVHTRMQDSARTADDVARRQLGGYGSNEGDGLSRGVTKRTASRAPRPSPSPRVTPRVADSKPTEDFGAAKEETAFMLRQAYRVGLAGMLESRQEAESAESAEEAAVAIVDPNRDGQRSRRQLDTRGLRLHQTPPLKHHVRQPQPRQMDWTLTEGHGGARPVHDKDNKDLLPRRHRSHLLRAPAHARSLAAQSEVTDRTAYNMATLAVASVSDAAAEAGGSPLSPPLSPPPSWTAKLSGRGSENAGEGREIELLKRKLQSLSYSQQGQDLLKLFTHFNRDNSGELDKEEFCLAVRQGLTATMLDDEALSKLFSAFDVDGRGTVDIGALTSWISGSDSALQLTDKQQPEPETGAMATIANKNDNAVRSRRIGITPAKRKTTTTRPRCAPGAETGEYDQLSEEEYDVYNDGEISELDDAVEPVMSSTHMDPRSPWTASGNSLNMALIPTSSAQSARELGRQANDRHKAEREANHSNRRLAVARQQALAAKKHSEELARATAIGIKETRKLLEQEASLAAEGEMRLYRARVARSRWRQRLLSSWLLRWRTNAVWQKQLVRSWSKLQKRIAKHHVRAGFLGWAHYTSVEKRSKVLLMHAQRRRSSDRLHEAFRVWVFEITDRRRVAQALDRTAGRRRHATMQLTFFGWCEAVIDERRSRWLASRVESNSWKRLLALTVGHWRIEARALARAAARKKEQAEAVERAKEREADRMAVLNNLAELVNRRRDPSLIHRHAPASAGDHDGQLSIEAVAEAVVTDLAEQEREAVLQQLAVTQADARNEKTRNKRRRGGLACCSRPRRRDRE